MATIERAEILSIGTELLLGEIIDTNSAYLAASLAEHGVDVLWSQRVGDNRSRIEAALERALERSDLLVLTGGLGPTEDDMTRESIASVLGETPGVDGELERWLRDRFSRFARHMPETNLKQAWLIPSAKALANPRGTAPGWLVSTSRNGSPRVLVALPGPPQELEYMWQNEVLPRLKFPAARLYARIFKTHGVGESAIAERLASLTAGANPSVATYARRDGVHVRIAAKAETIEEAKRIAKAAERTVEHQLADTVWGYDNDELPDLVIRALEVRNLRLAVAEWATGGRLSGTLANEWRVTGRFEGGLAAWSFEAMRILGIPRSTMEQGDPENVVASLAKEVRNLFATDLGLATYSAASPSSKNEGSEVVAFVAVVDGDGTNIRRCSLPSQGRTWQQERLTFEALVFLWSHLH